MPGPAMNRDFAAVAEALSRCRADWLLSMAPAAKVEGGVAYLGDAEGSAGRSFPVPMRPNGKALTDFNAGHVGTDLDLIMRLTGCSLLDAYREGLAILGWPADGPEPAPQRRARPVFVPIERDPEPDPRAERRCGWAQEAWRQAHPLCDCRQCEPGRIYLQEHRLIERWPEFVFFHPACPFGAGRRERSPAILAPVNCHRTVHVVGIWRIRLTPAGELVERTGLGDVRGNPSRLYWPEGDELAIAEGVEDSIAFHLLTGRPCWAALSAGNMHVLLLPERFRHVVVCQDNDRPDSKGRKAGQEAATVLKRRLEAEGRRVQLVAAGLGKDANDVLRSRRHG